MVSTRSPNFSALRAFEAAARHQNFSRAAEELNVSHGAISHQVRALERELGLALFVRHGRRVQITEPGLALAATLGSAFGQIADALALLRPGDASRRLSVSAVPSLAARWLAPRLGQFSERHPDIEVVLQASGQLQDLAREGIDVGLRFGDGVYPGLTVEYLMGDVYYPVASPTYRGGRLPDSPAALARATLLRCADEPWLPWFHAAGLPFAEPAGGVVFGDLSMLIRAAIDGEGVALTRHVAVQGEIASGRLVRLFTLASACPRHYYFVTAPGADAKPQVRAFRSWLKAQLAPLPACAGAP
ncbi:MAG: transcriptional regulator GcvA [Pseudomonadota bacterium]